MLITIVMGVLTVVGFLAQYLVFEGKLAVRDQRDVFLRTIDEPTCQVLRDLDRCAATARVLTRTPSDELTQALLLTLFQTRGDLDRQLVRNSQSKYDHGEDGWISVNIEDFDEQISVFDETRSPAALEGIVRNVDRLNQSIKPILEGCRSKAGL